MSHVVTKDFVACVPVRFFFSLSLIFTLLASPCQPLAFLIFSRLADTKFSRCLSNKVRLLFFFISRSSSFSVIHVSLDIKILSKKDWTSWLLFLSESPGDHAISRQKPRVPFGLPYLLIELFYIGIPAVWTDAGRVDVRSRDYQNFCKVVVLPIRPMAVLTLRLPSPSSHRKVPIAAKCVVKRCFAFYYPRTTNQVVACCTNTDLWLVKIKRESIPRTGFTSLAAKSVCLGRVKREMSTYFVTKSRTSTSTFRNNFRNLRQPDLLQDRFDSWVVKRATSLFKFCSNVA